MLHRSGCSQRHTMTSADISPSLIAFHGDPGRLLRVVRSELKLVDFSLKMIAGRAARSSKRKRSGVSCMVSSNRRLRLAGIARIDIHLLSKCFWLPGLLTLTSGMPSGGTHYLGNVCRHGSQVKRTPQCCPSASHCQAGSHIIYCRE